MKRLLLLSPTFHGYWRSIERALRDRGYDVVVCLYDELPTVRSKIAHKLSVEAPALLTPRAARSVAVPSFSRTAVTALRSGPWDIVLQLKGDALGSEYWETLQSSTAAKYLWLYDEVRRTRHTDETLAVFDGIALYNHSDHDALRDQGFHTAYVPDAFDPLDAPKRRETNDSVLFIGARNADRERILLQLKARGVPVLAVGRDWSRHPADRLRTWSWRRPDIPSTRDVPRLRGYAMIAGAPAALNVHFDQDGFTMRTFEIPGSGGVQLVDRDDVAEFYEPGREVAVFHSPEELGELSRRAISDPRWSAGLREAGRRRTLAEHTFAHRIRSVEALWA